MSTIVEMTKRRVKDLLEKINKENNELISSDNYLDLEQRFKNIDEINEEVSYFCEHFSNNHSIVYESNDNIYVSSKIFGNFSIVFKKTYLKDVLLYGYKIEGQSPIISTFLKYFSNFIYLNISFFSLEKRYLSTQKPLNISLKKEIDFIRESLINTQIYEKIVDNILNGVSYVKFNIRKNVSNNTLFIEMKNTYRNIPNFEKSSIYLPKIKDGTIKDYIATYKELNSLITCLVNETKSTISIDILKTSEYFRKEQLFTSSHDISTQLTNSKKIFKNDFLNIVKYIREIYIPEKPLGKNFFFVNFNMKDKSMFLAKTKNPAFLNLTISFDLSEDQYIRTNHPSLSQLFLNNSIYYHEIDKNKILEIIRIKENIKDF